jgi:hypothetical protein
MSDHLLCGGRFDEARALPGFRDQPALVANLLYAKGPPVVAPLSGVPPGVRDRLLTDPLMRVREGFRLLQLGRIAEAESLMEAAGDLKVTARSHAITFDFLDAGSRKPWVEDGCWQQIRARPQPFWVLDAAAGLTSQEGQVWMTRFLAEAQLVWQGEPVPQLARALWLSRKGERFGGADPSRARTSVPG